VESAEEQLQKESTTTDNTSIAGWPGNENMIEMQCSNIKKELHFSNAENGNSIIEDLSDKSDSKWI